MGFLLLDRPNPNGPHYYPSRRERVLAIVVHVTAGSEDLDTLDDNSAESVAQYAATTDREVSWHTGSDADSWVDLLPSSAVAWHATDYNGCTHGHEISKRTTDWRNMPAKWVDKTLRMAALGPDEKSGLRRKAIELGVPLRWATKAELDHARATGGGPVGFITHAELQWADRRDPGYVTEGGQVIDTFPRQQFMDLLNLQNKLPAKKGKKRMNGFTFEVLDGPSAGLGVLVDMENDRTTGITAVNLADAAAKAGTLHFGVNAAEAEDLLRKYGAGNPQES